MLDLIVIGAGSAGLAASKRVASHGKTVLLCDYDTIGGTCVSYGCIPKKAWHGIANFRYQSDLAIHQGWSYSNLTFDWKSVQPKLKQYIESLNHRHEQKCLDQKIAIVKGKATFIDEHTVDISGVRYSAKTILIAVGGSAAKLDVPGSEHCDTSYEFFSWDTLPASVALIGGGYIASELASILNALGVDVHIIIRKDLVLGGFDEDIQKTCHDDFIKRGISIHTGVVPTEFTLGAHDDIEISLSNNTSMVVGKVIQAVGRQPNTQRLNCQNANVKCSKNEAIFVNDDYQSSTPHIYAIGDCIDQRQLTPVAVAQGREWTDRVYLKLPHNVSYDMVPTAIFCLPEAATVGLTEAEANQKYDDISIKRLSFVPLAMALTTQKERVMMKLVLQGPEQNVLGIHMVGEGAAEIIQGLTVAMQKGITKADLDVTMALHPTITEELVTIDL